MLNTYISELISDTDKRLKINVLDIYISELKSETDEILKKIYFILHISEFNIRNINKYKQY